MAEVINNVDLTSQSGGGATINNQDISVSENGVYTADEGYTGLGTVTVNVPLVYPDFIVNGTGLVRNSYTFSNFSSSNYIYSSPAFAPEQNSWEIGFAFTTGPVSGEQSLIVSATPTPQFGITIQNGAFWCYLGGSDNTSIIDGVGSSILQENTKYYVKITFDNTTHTYKILYSTDKQTWTTERTVISNSYAIGSANNFYYGIYGYGGSFDKPFNGALDMSECYIKINDVITWQGISYN